MKDGKLLEKVSRRGRWESVDLGSYFVELYVKKPSPGKTGELLLRGGNTDDDLLVWRCWSEFDQDEEKGYVRTVRSKLL